MSVCALFGNRYVYENIDNRPETVLIELIENKKVKRLYVGNNGAFDRMAIAKLESLKRKYLHIEYTIVLAYLPANANEQSGNIIADTIYPDGLELVPRRFAISKRNSWMIDQSEYVVTYVKNTTGCANKLKLMAIRKGKNVIDIAEI